MKIKEAMTNLKNKAVGAYNKTIQAVNSKATPAMLAALMVAPSITASAAGEGEKAIQLVMKLIGIALLIRGAIGLGGGISAYGEAKEEGEGPAMSKAKQQLSAGIVMLALAAVFISTIGNALASTVSGQFSSLSW